MPYRKRRTESQRGSVNFLKGGQETGPFFSIVLSTSSLQIFSFFYLTNGYLTIYQLLATMEFIELAKKRFSLRKFSDKKVEQEKLDRILEAGRVAPTAVNKQPQRIIILNNEDSLDKVKRSTKYHFDAPVIMVICYDSEESWKNPINGVDGGILDASIVITQMMLEATNVGMGTTLVAYFDSEVVKKEFELPDNIVPVALLPLGYPAEDAQPSKSHGSRKKIDETVYYNSFK